MPVAETYYGAYLERRIHDPLFRCTVPYRCGDSIQSRLELERYRRMQDLRDGPTPSDPRVSGPNYGPWGPQRYLPPPTPDANIQPAYRDASRLRPEFQPSIQPIGEPATK
jgi:hypothetical protein